MKKRRQWILKGIGTILLSCSLLPSFGQEETTDTYDFNEIIEAKKVLYEKQGYSKAKTSKKLEKFIHYWETRLTEDGELGKITAAFPERRSGSRSGGVYCGTDNANWEIVGPGTYDGPAALDWQAGFNHKQWNGRMEEVYVPSDHSYYLASTFHGGIWRRAAGASGWTNVTQSLNFPFFRVSSIVASPYDDDHIFASCGGLGQGQGIIKSTDGGLTWSILTTFNDDYCAEYPTFCADSNDRYIDVLKMIIDPHQSSSASTIHMYALTRTDNSKSDVWKSINSGVSWTRMGDPGLTHTLPTLPVHHYWNDIEVDDIGHLLCSATDPFDADCRYWYYDPFVGWSDFTSQIAIPGYSTLRLNFASPDGNKVYALVDGLSGASVKREIRVSSDWGQNWSTLTFIPGFTGWGNANPKTEIEYHSATDRIYVGGIRLIEIDPSSPTVTSGSSLPQGHVDVRDIYFADSAGTSFIYTTNDGGISQVNAATATYKNLNGDYLPALEFQDVGVANMPADRIVGGVAHCHAFSLDNGSWTKFGGGDGDAGVFRQDVPTESFVTYGGGITRYHFPGGTTPSFTGGGGVIAGGGQFGSHVYTHPASSDTLYYVKLAKYLNVWEASSGWENRALHDSLRRPGEIGISRNTPGRMYLAEHNSNFGGGFEYRLFRSDASGKAGTWTPIGDGTVYDATGTTSLGTLDDELAWKKITDIEVSPYNADQLWISVSGFMKTDEDTRVLMSLDGGTSWREHSQGLPRYPVNALVLVPATNGLMFAGTEAGIFYRDNSMTEWECFNNGMPYATVTDLDYNTCNGYLYASTYGYGVWKTPISFEDAPLTYTSNVTIPLGTYEFNTDIVVKAPAVFTVLGTIEMANNRRITVEPGAALVIDGGTITNQCDLLWDGIYLGGDASAVQLTDGFTTDPNQATLVMKNNATVSLSRTGVTTQAYDAGFGHGARIFATSSNFVDNRFDVEMLQYTHTNRSYFRNCTFETTGPLPDPNYLDVHGRAMGTSTHVRLWAVNGVEFHQNVFQNTGTFDRDMKGTGIYSLDANLVVTGKCNAYDIWNCTGPALSFENLSRGIVFNSADNTHQLVVTQNLFDETVQGITANGGHDILIDDNKFLNYNGSDDDTGIDAMQSWGAYLTGTQGATVSDNEFEDGTANSPVLDYYTKGVVVQSSGIVSSEIIRNQFNEGEMIGVQGWLNNDGLQISCNEFYSDYGIYIDRPDSGISTLPTQGTMDEPVGNQFFKTCSDNESHIYFDGIDPLSPWETILIYNHYNGTFTEPTCISSDLNYTAYTNATNFSPGFVMTEKHADFGDGTCNPSGGGGEGEGEFSIISSEEERVLKSLLSEIESIDELDKDEVLPYLIENNWVVESGTGEYTPGEKSRRTALLLKKRAHTDALLAETAMNEEGDSRTDDMETNNPWTALAQNSAAFDSEEPSVTVVENLPKDYTALYTVLAELKADGKSYLQLTEQQKEILRSIAGNYSSAGQKAAAILAFVSDEDYIPYVDKLDQGTANTVYENNVVVPEIQIFPNPANDHVTVMIPDALNFENLTVYNVLGEVIYQSTVQSTLEIDLTNWTKGVYVVVLQSETEKQIAKLIVD